MLFPPPHKLLLAEKRIIETELEQLKRRQENPGQKAQTLPPRELFPLTTQGSHESSVSSPTQASNLVLFNNVYSVTNTGTVSTNIESEIAEALQVCNQTSSSLQKRETELKQDSELLAVQIKSVRDLLTKKTRVFENSGKIMKLEAPGSKSCVLFVTLQDTTRTNAAMVRGKEFPSATTAINIQKLEQKYKSLKKWSKTWRKGKKSQRMNLTYPRLQEKEQQAVSSQ